MKWVTASLRNSHCIIYTKYQTSVVFWKM